MKKELMSNAKVWPDMKQRSGAVSQNQKEFQITASPFCRWTSDVSNLPSGESESKVQPVSLGEKTSSSMPRLRLNRVIEFVDANIALDLCVSTLASVAGMSSFYFCRSFKQSTGITPHRYVLTRRMEHAKQLLQEKTVSLVQVAHEVGFADQSQFTRVFHKIVGTTPSQYRKFCRMADS